MSTKETLDTIEETLDILDEVGSTVIVKKTAVGVLALMWVGGAAAGSLATYFIVKKRLDATYDDRLAEELQTSIDFLASQQVDFSKTIVTEEVPQDTEVEEIEEIEEDAPDEFEGMRLVETKPPIEELAAKNQAVQYNKIVEAQQYDTALLKEEEHIDEPDFETVNPDISVIGRDLFMTNVSEWPQTTLTYFSDGGVLDLQGDFVPEHENLIGVGKPPFGEMSEDENIVYLRNKKEQTEYEVLWDPGQAGEFLRHSLGEMYGRDHRR